MIHTVHGSDGVLRALVQLAHEREQATEPVLAGLIAAAWRAATGRSAQSSLAIR